MIKRLLRTSEPGEVAVHSPRPDGGCARAALLDLIGDFLLRHDLDINPANYAVAHAVFAGGNLALAGKISAREIAGEPITQQWLDTAAGKPGKSEHTEFGAEQPAELDRLMDRLETSVDAFAMTASRAQGATAKYGNSLEEHVARIDRDAATGEALSSFAGIARAMLERTRSLEDEMRRSSDEAASLRQGLERARREAEIDHLTGLPNRRAFEAALDVNYREARREIEPLSVAFCDIDNFKRVNDVHGHDTGDRVIQAIGEVLNQISNDRCHVARHGSEEFVLLFRGATVADATERLERAREQLAARNFINRATDAPIGQITFSGGVADVFAYADPREALKAADTALYRAKDEGRNRICVAQL
ncbi:MAG: GGDEF domain-containing protein [Pseudomonadota bacterium]